MHLDACAISSAGKLFGEASCAEIGLWEASKSSLILGVIELDASPATSLVSFFQFHGKVDPHLGA